ncbi:threonine synthase [Alkalibaculum sp. M08DMB]|uniref:Threonine synthase n=1 Tax=Alkalibaculum sporogenes TaxID=2655001 RepID=A0A6A7KBW7_9FIRM|nr:threonine synthase [Alkalibaculum sporogenes]MPW26914.1 threonine synthase [Alkalibaculum sporogenes]
MNISFQSTRSNQKVSSSLAILKGISDEGGLFVPDSFPSVNVSNLENLNYQEICFSILSKFLTEFEEDSLKEIINKSYEKFSVKEVAPVVNIGNNYILELFHGPTLAFKDVALSILPHLIIKSAKIQQIEDEIVILTATSGDTGKAALEGFSNIENTKIFVFYPSDGVSEIQKKQMTTQEGNNVFVYGIQGNFDDAQNGVKNIFNDNSFKKELQEKNIILSSANSINIGRLLPQIVYYFSSYIELVNKGSIAMNDEVNFTVPTGNFGNILAGYYAKEMGLPINKLICASNSNNVLYDFFKTGSYDKNREFIKTMSPSMDILISSNFERLLFHMSGNNTDLINQWMNKLNAQGSYTIPDSVKNSIDKLFFGSFCNEEDTKNIISEVYKEYNYVLDTHTAVAYKAYQDYLSETNDTTTNVILSTASPFKFTKSVYESIFGIQNQEEYSLINELSNKASLTVPKPIKNLKNSTVLHKDIIPSNAMKEIIEKILL